jgi:predicted PurR-regulated permease PerM
MPGSNDANSWFTDQQALLALVLVVLALATLVVLPYLQYVLLAVILAYVLWPLQVRIRTRVQPTAAALSLTVGTLLIILLPVGYVLLLAVREAVGLLQIFERGEFDVQGIQTQLAEFGIAVDLTQFYVQYRTQIGRAVEGVAWTLFDFVRGLPGVFIGLTITLFVVFVLLRDGDRLVAWLRRVTPVRRGVYNELSERVDSLMYASVVGNVGASAIQAVTLGIGLALLGFENISFLVVVTFVLALLPLVGAFAVWVPLVGYLVLVGRPGAAAALFILGSLVSVSDFYTRPLIIGRSAALNSAIIVLEVFGGIVEFGPMGLLIGPVVLGAAKISIDILVRERTGDQNGPFAS